MKELKNCQLIWLIIFHNNGHDVKKLNANFFARIAFPILNNQILK